MPIWSRGVSARLSSFRTLGLRLAAAFAVTLAAPAASAAPAQALGPASLWTGGYSGLNLGFGDGRLEQRPAAAGLNQLQAPVVGGSASIRGPALTANVGYNWAIGRAVVFGIEARSVLTPFNTSDGAARVSALSALNYRIGYARNRTLVYLFGGLAAAQMKIGGWGYVGKGFDYGAGIEYAIAGRLAARAEVTLGRLKTMNSYTGELLSYRYRLTSIGLTYRF